MIEQGSLQTLPKAERQKLAEQLRQPVELHREGMALLRSAGPSDVRQKLAACSLLFEATQIDSSYGTEFPELGLQFPSDAVRDEAVKAHTGFIREGGTQYVEQYIAMMREVNVKLGLERPEDDLGDEGMIPAWHAQQRQRTIDLGPLVGERCELFGLQARPDLNGCTCVANRFSAERGRYTVTIDNTNERVRIKPANMRKI
eukprot:SAG31_NODE_5453_length_2531_cov_1.683799_1_plen_201_part_00